MIKAAFFDIDGTLIHEKTGHELPKGTKQALIELRRRGIKLFIATGRSQVYLPDFLKDGFPGFDGFDGFITMNGSYCYDKNGVYSQHAITQKETEEFYRLVESGEFSGMALFPDHAFVNELSPEVLQNSKEVGIEYHVEDFSQVLHEPVYQFCAYIPPEKDAWLQGIMSNCLITRWCDLFCDVVPVDSSKPAGLKATLEHLGLTREEAIAFGDGGNDCTMLECAGIGVAMGNATQECKTSADYITTEVYNDGVAEALRHFELID